LTTVEPTIRTGSLVAIVTAGVALVETQDPE
jgi:hypothetical protein